jgi:uncharacterized membrane protein
VRLSLRDPVCLGEIDDLGALVPTVLVPTAPVPVGGGQLCVPAAWATPTELGMDGLTSICVSMGITSHQHLGAAR